MVIKLFYLIFLSNALSAKKIITLKQIKKPIRTTPIAWSTKISSIEITEPVSLKRVISAIAANSGIKLNMINIVDVTGVRYSAKGIKAFNLIKDLSALAKWKMNIASDGCITLMQDNAYWYMHSVTLLTNKRTSTATSNLMQESNVSKSESTASRDPWNELQEALTALKERKDIEDFRILPQSSAISVCATQSMQRQIHKIIEEIQYNIGTQIEIEMKVVTVNPNKPNSIQWNFGRQKLSSDDSITSNALDIIRGRDEQGATSDSVKYKGEKVLIQNIASGINLLSKVGTVNVLMECKTKILNNEASTVSSTASEVQFSKEFGEHKNQNISRSVSKQIPVGLAVHVTGSAVDDKSAQIWLQLAMSEVGEKTFEDPYGGKDGGKNKLSSIKENLINTTFLAKTGKIEWLTGVVRKESTPGAFGINHGMFLAHGKHDAVRRVEVFIAVNVKRPTKVKSSTKILKQYEIIEWNA